MGESIFGGNGLLRQLKKSNECYYTNLTLENLNEFLDNLSKNKPSEIFVYLGDFNTRYLNAVLNNDELEIEKLNEEALMFRIKRYKEISVKTNIDYDIIYMLSSKFSLLNTFGDDVTWNIETKYFHEHEYDDSYETTELCFSNNVWNMEKYFSDGYWETKLISKKEINKNKLFDLII